MKAQQVRARNARGDNESMSSQKPDLMAFDTPSQFVYDHSPITAKVIATFIDGVKCDEITTQGEIILDQTTSMQRWEDSVLILERCLMRQHC